MHKALKSLCLLFSSWVCKSDTYLLNEACLAHPPALPCSNSVPSCASLLLPLITLVHIFQSRQCEGCCQKTGRMVSTAHKAETVFWIRQKEAPSRLSGSLMSAGRSSVHDIHLWWWVSCSPFLWGILLLLPVVRLRACWLQGQGSSYLWTLRGKKYREEGISPHFFMRRNPLTNDIDLNEHEFSCLLQDISHFAVCLYYLFIVCNLKKQKWSKPQGAAFFSTFARTPINSNSAIQLSLICRFQIQNLENGKEFSVPEGCKRPAKWWFTKKNKTKQTSSLLLTCKMSNDCRAQIHFI